MKKSSIILILILFVFSFTFIWAEEPIVTAPSAILIDSKSGKVLYEKNADEKRYPASTTKVMTGLLTIENNKLDELVTIKDDVPGQIERGSSQISLIPGEQLTMEQLLYGLMLESANDAAVAIAEQISGNVGQFAIKMNEKAKVLGATHTNFVNPNGLHSDNHYTTARDLSAIARYAMALPKFREVVSTVKYEIPKTNKQEKRDYITNGNKLIWKNYGQYRYEYATGIKTGYTTKSKGCLVASAKKGDTELIAVIMGAESHNIYIDSTALFEYGFSNFQDTALLQENQIVTTVPVKDSTTKINLLAAESFSLLLNQSEKSLVKSTIKSNDTIKTPIKKGDKLGSVTYTINDKEIKKIDLISSQDLIPAKVDKVGTSKWILFLIFTFLVYRTAVTVYKIQRKKNRRKMLYVKRW